MSLDLNLTESVEMLKKTALDFMRRDAPKEVVQRLQETDTGITDELWRKAVDTKKGNSYKAIYNKTQIMRSPRFVRTTRENGSGGKQLCELRKLSSSGFLRHHLSR